MHALDALSQWYKAQCNGDWEHSYGISIDTLDNPGWALRIDLTETPLANLPFATLNRGDSESDSDWIHCSVQSKQFVASGGATNLNELVEIFLTWSAQA